MCCGGYKAQACGGGLRGKKEQSGILKGFGLFFLSLPKQKRHVEREGEKPFGSAYIIVPKLNGFADMVFFRMI